MTNKTKQQKEWGLIAAILFITSAVNYSNAQPVASLAPMESLRTSIDQFGTDGAKDATSMDVQGLMDSPIQSPDPSVASIIGDGKIEPIATETDMNQLPSPKWYSRDSRQGHMEFVSYVLFPVDRNEISNILTTHHDEIMEVVDFQLKHMFGAFTEHPNFKNNPGIPSGDSKVD
ncbi:hypothetical protein HY772_07520, partial [Candidatus Woesearchaeota archaeon]|nr:hypothetical protein [Candidatus Woesearchaeota archaeon]